MTTLVDERKTGLEQFQRLYQFYKDIEDQEEWIREKKHLMASDDFGYDLDSVHLLLSKHKALEEEMSARHTHLDSVVKTGNDLISTGNDETVKVKLCVDNIKKQWDRLMDLVASRKKKLNESESFYQFFFDADIVDTWMMDTRKSVNCEDVGTDESSAQSLLKSQMEVIDKLKNYKSTAIQALHEQATSLGEENSTIFEIQARLSQVDKRYSELLEMAELCKQRLMDASSLYKLISESDDVEMWMEEKEKFLTSTLGSDKKATTKLNFDIFEQEMVANSSKIDEINKLANQLLTKEHPNSDEITIKQNKVTKRWNLFKELVEKKCADNSLVQGSQNFGIVCDDSVIG